METSKQSTLSFAFEDNSFDVLRLISALLIVLGHIVTHLNCNVWKPLLTIQQNWPGLLCLFTLTGYLIPASLERSRTKKEFLVKRISRIVGCVCGIFCNGNFNRGGVSPSSV